MLATSQKEFIEYFSDIEDPREDERLLYPLSEILFLVFVGVLCGAESWRELVIFGEERINFLREYLEYEHGIPTKSSLSRIFSLIDKKCIESWLENVAMRMVKNSVKKEQIAIDGKALRGKQKLESNSQGAHIVNMFATKLGLVLCQKTVPNKGNELAAIKEILEHANLEDTTISIDAIACHKEVTKIKKKKKGHYFLALKKNQINLYKDVEDLFKENGKNLDFHETKNNGHGRIETRSCLSTSDIQEIKTKHPEWIQLRSVVQVISEREIKGKTSIKIRYYLSSEESDAKKQLDYSRSHWAIENNLHWSLDVLFKEDASSIRKNYAAENISAIRKIIINVIKKYKEKTGNKNGINIIRKSAGWDSSMHTIREILVSWLHA